jgi:hypothetical protein
LFKAQVLKDAAKNMAAGKNGLYIARIEVGIGLPEEWKDILLTQGFDIDAIEE